MSGGTRVLQVVGSLDIGGAETMIVAATRELRRMGMEVDFLVFSEQRGALEPDVLGLDCRVLRIASPSTVGHRRFLQGLVDLLRTEGPFDAVHSHINLASGFVLTAAAKAGVPIRVAHAHNTHLPGRGFRRLIYTAWAKHLISTRATTMVACGEQAGRHLFGREWKDNGVVVPNGTDVRAILAARSSGREIREALSLEENTILIGVIGRLVPQKNHAFLLDVLSSGNDSRVHLLIVGEGPLKNDLQVLVQERRLDRRVTFLGLRRDIPQILAALEHLVMPSLHEGLPVTLVEAQACGTSAIVSSTVTREVDLGLGLLQFLSLNDAEQWDQALRKPPPEVSEADIVRRFEETGYDSVTTARQLASLYTDVR